MVPCAVLALAVVLCARPVQAQSTANPQPTPVEFLPRSTFYMSAEHLSGDDVMFVWDANFGGDLDVLDYGKGRATFLANYQAILGDEFRHFDPNQGNYILLGTGSMRTEYAEVSGVFYHQSRHLADRANRVPVAWNMMGGRGQRRFMAGRTALDAQIDVRGVIQKSFVDYTWEIDTLVRSDMQIYDGIHAILGGNLRLLGVDGSQNRGNQTGFRAEGGVRFQGGSAAMELFLAAERRIDPYPLQFGTAHWVTVGFRLLSR